MGYRCLPKLFLMCLMVKGIAFISFANATVVAPKVVNVDRILAKNIGLSIEVDKVACAGTMDLYIKFPQYYGGAIVKSVDLEVRRAKKLMLYAGLRIHDPYNADTTENSKMSTFCINENWLDNATIIIIYGKGQFSTDELRLKGLKKFLSEKESN